MPKFCPDCGQPIIDSNLPFCPKCGAKLPPDTPSPQPKEPKKEKSEEKSPFVALLCSFFIPGLGQVYNGETAKGVGLLFGTLIGCCIFVIPGLLVWLYGLYDAYSTAQKMNAGEITFKPTKTAHLILFLILVAFIIAVVVFAIFLFALASVATPATSTYSSAVQSSSSQPQTVFAFSDVKMTTEGDYFKTTYLTGKITNKGTESNGKYVQIQALFYDKNGVRLGDDSTYVSNLKSGETAVFKILLSDDNIIKNTAKWEVTAKGYGIG